MKLTNFENLIYEISKMELPISNTLKGKLIHQTFRNKLTSQLKEALYTDCAEDLLEKGEVIPYLVKEGIILEIPNESIANALGPHDLGSGALSIEISVAIKGLDTDAATIADNFNFEKEIKAQNEEKRAKERKKEFEKKQAIREAKAKCKSKVQELIDQLGTKTIK